MEIQTEIATAAVDLAKNIKANAILTLTEKGEVYDYLLEKSEGMNVIALTPNRETYERLKEKENAKIVDFTVRDPSRMGQIRHAVWRSLNNGLLSPGDLVVCLTGEMGETGGTDTISVYLISETESTLAGVIESDPVMNATVEICTELGWKGREGEPVGAAFLIGDVDKVMNLSHQLGLNPFKGYQNIPITDRENWELIKRYAFLDGAFILDDEGEIIAAGRYLGADATVDIPTGLGTRHLAVASMTAATHSKGVTVSGTDGVVRIFSDGKILGEIDPRSRLLKEMEV